jgi:hypothetical protein
VGQNRGASTLRERERKRERKKRESDRKKEGGKKPDRERERMRERNKGNAFEREAFRSDWTKIALKLQQTQFF